MQTKRYHLTVDIDGCKPESLGEGTVEKILTELPPLIGMHILYGPIVVDGIAENPGISGFVIIDYSHISIHTFTKCNDFMIDIFSCKPYERQTVIAYLAKVLNKAEEDIQIKVVGWG